MLLENQVNNMNTALALEKVAELIQNWGQNVVRTQQHENNVRLDMSDGRHIELAFGNTNMNGVPSIDFMLFSAQDQLLEQWYALDFEELSTSVDTYVSNPTGAAQAAPGF